MNERLEIVPAQPEDAQELTRIALAAKRYWGYPENWMAHWQEMLTITPRCVRENDAYKALQEGRIVGFYVLTNTPRQLELKHMWVDPAEIGHGIGRALMEHVIRQTADAELPNMEIESDPNAEGFYLKMGARRVGARIYKLEGQQRVLPLLFLSIQLAREKLDQGLSPS